MRVIKENIKRTLRYISVSLLIFSITPLCDRDTVLIGARSVNAYTGEDLVCAIDLGDDMYGSHGLETGLCYELLCRFAQDNHCSVRIVTSGRNTCYLDSLQNGKVDVVITHALDSLDGDDLNVLRKMNDCSAWVLGTRNQDKVRQMNAWLSHMAASEEYAGLKKRFKSSFNPHKRAEMGLTADSVSPYDGIIRKYAALLGWDWRMLAAVIYQESKFSICSSSFRGAQGLMQIMPQTGRYYGVEDLLDPDRNLEAGVKHLQRLQNLWKGTGMTEMELIKFTLAAYNAGEGRIADCRNFAAAMGHDNNSWDEIQKLIPLMREDSILTEPSVKLGKFQGHETIAYIDSILSLYDAICTICPSV